MKQTAWNYTEPKQYPIPEHILKALKIWADTTDGKIPVWGGFMTAVLENDLSAAVARGDNESLRAMPAIVMWLLNNAPAGCWGSPSAVQGWVSVKEDIARHSN